MKPICRRCEQEMTLALVGQAVVYHQRNGDPYYLVRGDVFECAVCGALIMTRFGEEFWHFEPGFKYDLAHASLAIHVYEGETSRRCFCVAHGLRWDKGRYASCPLCVVEERLPEAFEQMRILREEIGMLSVRIHEEA